VCAKQLLTTYLGLSDFHYSTTHSPFMTKVRDTIMTGNCRFILRNKPPYLTSPVQKVKQFHLDPSRGVKPMEDLIPPPTFSDHTLPFNWAYHQNEHIRRGVDPTSGQTVLINYSAPKKMNTYYIPHTTISVPKEPQEQLSPSEAPILEELLTEMRIAFEERPIWTRRALGNRVGQRENSYNFRRAMSYVGYQFRGGPWRDGVIKYGVDPRTDTQYRIYQTLFFKIFDEAEKGSGVPWMDGRIEYSRKPNDDVNDRNSHIFDGTSVKLDGKVWQICDITDPLLSRLLSTNNLRSDCDVDVDGWFCNGTMAKVKAIMRAKISAIRLGRSITEQDFKTTLQIPDHVEGKTSAKKINVPVPDWRVERDQKGKLGVDASLSGLRRREAKNEKGIGTRGNNKIRVGSARGGRGGSVETRGGEGDEGGEGSVDTYGDGNSQGEHDAEGDLEAATPEIIPVVRERRKKTSGKMRVGSRLWRRKPEDRETFGALPAATQVPISAAAIPGFYGGGPLGREAGSKSSISQDDSIATDTNEGRTGSIGAATSGSVAEVDPRILETMHALNDQGGFETIEEGQFEKALGNPFLPGEFVDEDEGDDGEEDEVEEEDEDMDDEQDPEEEDDMDDGEDAF